MDDFNFKRYGHVNIESLQEKIIKAGFNWEEYAFRQQKYTVHKETKTIPLLWNEGDFLHLKYWENYSLFNDDIDKIHEIIENVLGVEGTICTALLIKLEKNSKVYPHFDAAPFFKISKRFHIPIFTNPQCFFTVDKEIINMKSGEIWEINNDGKIHSVENNGTTDRIHLLMDWKENR